LSVANLYCESLGIRQPRLEEVKDHPEANTYGFLIVALLERGAPMTLVEAARRFEEAGIAPASRALESLQRCKPGRPPIYRDGDIYALDPHNEEAGRWAFRLGLRPPKVAAQPIAVPDLRPLPPLDRPPAIAELREAWREGIPANWSAQRIAICVLDAHAKPMAAGEVLNFVQANGQTNRLSTDSAERWGEGSPIRVRDDGLWELDADHDAVRAARQAIRVRIVQVRRWAQTRPDRSAIEAARKRFEQEREANARRLAAMLRVVVYAFPPNNPEAIVLVDVARREVATFVGDEIGEAKERLAGYDIIAALDVRPRFCGRSGSIRATAASLTSGRHKKPGSSTGEAGRSRLRRASSFRARAASAVPSRQRKFCVTICVMVITRNSDAGSKQTPSPFSPFTNTAACTVRCGCAGDSLTRDSPRRGFILMSLCCTRSCGAPTISDRRWKLSPEARRGGPIRGRAPSACSFSRVKQDGRFGLWTKAAMQ